MNIWYQSLIKPPLTPPSAYFPIAWGVLYTLMGAAFIIILLKPASKNKRVAMYLFFGQLILNLAWSPLFFGMKSITAGLIDVFLLLVVLVYTVTYFFRISKLAGMLLVPYLLQVIFALYLNSGLFLLN